MVNGKYEPCMLSILLVIDISQHLRIKYFLCKLLWLYCFKNPINMNNKNVNNKNMNITQIQNMHKEKSA
jgi:hypothetical protein